MVQDALRKILQVADAQSNSIIGYRDVASWPIGALEAFVEAGAEGTQERSRGRRGRDGGDVVSEWIYFPHRRCISSFAKSATDPLQRTFPFARP